jgi:predicted outer membrane protein
MKRRRISRRTRRNLFTFGCIAVVATAAILGSGQPGQAHGGGETWETESGDVELDTTSRDQPGIWFNDSSIVALIREMNVPAMDAARLQMTYWSDPATMDFARQLHDEHAGMGATLDSVARATGLAPARPAIADSVLLRYADQVSAIAGLPIKQLEERFPAVQIGAHQRALRDLEALAAVTTAPELQAAILTKIIPMERAHLALLQRRQLARAQADSAARATLGVRPDSTR